MRLNEKLSIIGDGPVAYFIAYMLYLESKQAGDRRITIYGKPLENTKPLAENLFPSLSPNELSVIPVGKQLINALQHPYYKLNGGLGIDLPEINDAKTTEEFINEVLKSSLDNEKYRYRARVLDDFGQYAMWVWSHLYQQADPRLRQILDDCQFIACPKTAEGVKNGYRMNVYYNTSGIEKSLASVVTHFQSLGYTSTAVLTPNEVMEKDPLLTDFCNDYSKLNDQNVRVWTKGASVLWKPGGSIDTHKFMPLFAEYLKAVMGSYTNDQGLQKKCFRVKRREVTGLAFDPLQHNKLIGLTFSPNKNHDKKHYKHHEFILCPGSAVGTLRRFGLYEPAAARFVGSSLKLQLPLSRVKDADLSTYQMHLALSSNQCASVCRAGVDGKNCFIGIAGTTTFYGETEPKMTDSFAQIQQVFQLNLLNRVFPRFISICLGENTRNKTLTVIHLQRLIDEQIIFRAVGSRAVSFDGAPTIDSGIRRPSGEKITNLCVITHLSSAGVSNAPAAVATSIFLKGRQHPIFHVPKELGQRVLEVSRSTRADIHYQQPSTMQSKL